MATETPRVLATTVLAIVVAGLMCAGGGSGNTPERDDFEFPSRRRRAPRGLEALSPGPGAFPICVQLWQRGVRIGEDEGMAVFGEGWLLFEGRRSRFAVRNREALLASDLNHRLHLGDGQWAEVIPYDQIGERRNLRERFDAELRRWKLEPTPTGSPTLPPLTVHPRAWGMALGAALNGSLLVLAATFGGMLLSNRIAWAVAAVVAACGLWRFGMGIRDLYRLTRLHASQSLMRHSSSS